MGRLTEERHSTRKTSPGDSTALGLEAVTQGMEHMKELRQEAQQGTGEIRNCGLGFREVCLLSLQAGQFQTNRVRATVAPLPMTPTPGRAPQMPAARESSSEAFFWPSREEAREEKEEEYPSGP